MGSRLSSAPPDCSSIPPVCRIRRFPSLLIHSQRPQTQRLSSAPPDCSSIPPVCRIRRFPSLLIHSQRPQTQRLIRFLRTHRRQISTSERPDSCRSTLLESCSSSIRTSARLILISTI